MFSNACSTGTLPSSWIPWKTKPYLVPASRRTGQSGTALPQEPPVADHCSEVRPTRPVATRAASPSPFWRAPCIPDIPPWRAFLLEQDDGLFVVADAVLSPEPLDESLELGIAGRGVPVFHFRERIADAEDPLPEAESSNAGRQDGSGAYDLDKLPRREGAVADYGLPLGYFDWRIWLEAPHHDPFGIERLQGPQRLHLRQKPFFAGVEKDLLSPGGLQLGEGPVARPLGELDLSDAAELREVDAFDEVGPALRGLGRLDELDQRQTAAELLEGADPMGSIEDQAASA